MMANTMAKTLTPTALVGAFLSKVLPLIIIFGLLLFVFLVSFFDMDVTTAIWTVLFIIVGIIIIAVAAYLAYKFMLALLQTTVELVRDLAVMILKMAFELIKLALAMGANATIIAAILIVAMAFIVIAPLILLAAIVILGLILLAFIIVAAILATTVVVIIQTLANLITGIIGTIAGLALKYFEFLGQVYNLIADTLVNIITIIADLILGIIDGISNLILGILNAFAEIPLKLMQGFTQLVTGILKALFGGGDGESDSKAFEKALMPTNGILLRILAALGGGNGSNNNFAAMIEPLLKPMKDLETVMSTYAKDVAKANGNITTGSAPAGGTYTSNASQNAYSYPTDYSTVNTTNNNLVNNTSSESLDTNSDDIKELKKLVKTLCDNTEKIFSKMSTSSTGGIFGF